MCSSDLHNIRDTGASRLFNLIDFDNTLLNHPRAANDRVLIAAANEQFYYPEDNTSMRIKDWWLMTGNDCILRPDYTLYVCKLTSKNEIASINIDVDGLTNSFGDFPGDWAEVQVDDPDLKVGSVSHFGYSGADRRTNIITKNPGMTGLTGDYGWYVNFNSGSPAVTKLRCAQIPYVNGVHTYVIMAIKYPAAATFTIKTDHWWNSDYDTNVAAATSFLEMYNDENGLKYFVKTSPLGEKWLMLKLVNRYYDLDGPSADNYYERDGARLYDAWAGSYFYDVAVSCPGCTTVTAPGGSTMFTVRDEVPPLVSTML